MTAQIKPGDGPGHEIVENLIKERVSQARKEEMLAVYEDLIQTIWNRILPTLGRVTVIAILERALVLTKVKYPLVGHFQVTPSGVTFDELHQQIAEEEYVDMRDALKELVANLIDILAMLTGDILVRHLVKEIGGRLNS